MLLLLIALALFGCVVTGTLAVLGPKDDSVRRRLLVSTTTPASDRRLESSFGRRLIRPTLARAGHRAAAILPHNLVHKIDRMLVMANEPWSLSGFLGSWAAVIVLAVLFVLYLAAVGSLTALQVTVLGAVIVMFAALIPYAVLRRRVMRRHKQITRALPDAIDLLVTCVEAGIGVDSAFSMVTERTDGALSEAFSLYLRQVGLGRARKDALLFIADRTGVPDLVVMAASVAQGEDLGTPLGDVLRAQAEDLRVVRRQRAQEAAEKAPVKMTIPLVLCFLPAMAAVTVVPAILNLLDYVKTV